MMQFVYINKQTNQSNNQINETLIRMQRLIKGKQKYDQILNPLTVTTF